MGKRPKHGFREVVKNPDLFRAESEEMAEAEAAPPPTSKEIARLVAKMGKQRLDYAARQKLAKAEEKVIPFLLRALKNEEFLLHRYGQDRSDGSPLETALEYLEPFGGPDASTLEPALRHPDVYFQRRALYHLARCGNDDAIEALKSGLKSPLEECRTWTLMGLCFLKDSIRGSERFRSELFAAVVPTLADPESGPKEHAPRALLALDLNRARGVLLSEEILSAANPSIWRVLEALKHREVLVPAPQLRKLLSTMKVNAAKFPMDYAYADGLLLLAQSQGLQAKDLITDAQAWGNECVREGAAEALAIAAKLGDLYNVALERYQRRGAAGLTKPQFYYLSLFWLDAEVNNGGFAQYYFNSSSELAAHAVEAATAVGARQKAELIRQANALFGKTGPNPDRDKRMDQLSKIDPAALDKLDNLYYKSPEKLRTILLEYAASNAEAFRPGRQ